MKTLELIYVECAKIGYVKGTGNGLETVERRA